MHNNLFFYKDDMDNTVYPDAKIIIIKNAVQSNIVIGQAHEDWLTFQYHCLYCHSLYYISKLVHALWLVNLAVRTFLHRPLNCCKTYHQILTTYTANKSSKLSFPLNCVPNCAHDLKTISNWFVLLSTCFRNLKPFLMNGNRSRIFQTNNRDIINILLTSSSRSVP